MDHPKTFCIRCTSEISADATTCPECGTNQNVTDRRPGSGTAAPPPAGWQAAPPPASPTGYTVEEP